MSIRKSSRNDMRRPLLPGEPLPPGAELRRQGPPPFEVTAVAGEAEMLVRILCPISADNVPLCLEGFRKLAAVHPAPKVVLDMSKCPFLDTPGLGTLVEVRKELAAAGRTLWLQAPSRSVTRLLNLTKMTRLFPLRPVTPEPPDAVAVWPPSAG